MRIDCMEAMANQEMMKGEPLKDREGYDSAFKKITFEKEDIKSAVEWLKENIVEKQRKDQSLTQSKRIRRRNLKVMRLIDQAFEDVSQSTDKEKEK